MTITSPAEAPSWIPQWEISKADVCRVIAGQASTFKIVTKVRDNPAFLRDWVEHHSRIVGPQNLVIMDNMSVDPAMFEIYEKLRDAAVIFRFNTFHNRVHRVHEYPELYQALRRSTRYYQVIDADERLVHVSDALTYSAGPEIVDRLAEMDLPVIPAPWLENVLAYANRFHLFQGDKLRLNFSHGKPIISSGTEVSGMINHNFQISHELYGSLYTNFWVLHLLRLSPKQRIQANVTKLIANKIITSETPLESLLELDPDTIVANNNNPRNWLREIHDLWGKPEEGPHDAPLGDGELFFAPDGTLRFAEAARGEAIIRLLQKPETVRTRLVRHAPGAAPEKK